jgi:hypothetical protein
MILNHLEDDFDDYLNLLSALQLEKEYALRQLVVTQYKPKECTWEKNFELINLTLQYFDVSTIRKYFSFFWTYVDWDKWNDNFFIDNNDLIGFEKLKELKRKSLFFDFTKLKHSETLPCTERKSFSEKFHKVFSDFKNLKICHGNYTSVYFYNDIFCTNEVKVLGRACETCKKLQCNECFYYPCNCREI